MRDRSMRSETEKAQEIQLTDWSTAGNLSNRSSGVQIPCDICTRFGRYLYSTRCSWIIKVDSSSCCCLRSQCCLIHDKWHIVLQSESVFELRALPALFNKNQSKRHSAWSKSKMSINKYYFPPTCFAREPRVTYILVSTWKDKTLSRIVVLSRNKTLTMQW